MRARCLSTYADLDREGYSSRALARLSDGRVFPNRLQFRRAEVATLRSTKMTRMSISGVQDKLSLRLYRGRLEAVETGGQYILKPIPSGALPRRVEEVPANESLTMQLAERVFRIPTAANALIRLADNELAYITRRFDRTRDGGRVAQEDFCQLMGRTVSGNGLSYKYDTSYEELAEALQRYCPTYAIESERLFRQVLFNFLVGNGDAHLKNFSLRETELGDYILSPAYDLLCTRLHIPSDTRLALNLLADDEIARGEQTHGFHTGADFLELGRRMGLRPSRARAILDDILGHEDEVRGLVGRSFLSHGAQKAYLSEVSQGRVCLGTDR